MQPCESVVNHPLPCAFYASFQKFQISASDFGTVTMHRQFRTYVYEFPITVTEGLVHNVHKVVIRSINQ